MRILYQLIFMSFFFSCTEETSSNKMELKSVSTFFPENETKVVKFIDTTNGGNGEKLKLLFRDSLVDKNNSVDSYFSMYKKGTTCISKTN